MRLKVLERCCNDVAALDLQRAVNVQFITIQDCCFRLVGQFELSGLNKLKEVRIGVSSFTTHERNYEMNEACSFCIRDCSELTLLSIGEYSFSDYAGGFVLQSNA